MISILKIIQIVMFSLLIFPTFYIFIREPFIKYKKYRKQRLTISGVIFLSSVLIFMILSIIITSNDELYSTMKYAPFIQSWIIVKSSLIVYAQIVSLMIFLIGVYFWFILVTEKRMSKMEYSLLDCKIPHRLSLREKLAYPYMFYEMYVNVKKSKDDYYILTEYAVKDLLEYESKVK